MLIRGMSSVIIKMKIFCGTFQRPKYRIRKINQTDLFLSFMYWRSNVSYLKELFYMIHSLSFIMLIMLLLNQNTCNKQIVVFVSFPSLIPFVVLSVGDYITRINKTDDISKWLIIFG